MTCVHGHTEHTSSYVGLQQCIHTHRESSGCNAPADMICSAVWILQNDHEFMHSKECPTHQEAGLLQLRLQEGVRRWRQFGALRFLCDPRSRLRRLLWRPRSCRQWRQQCFCGLMRPALLFLHGLGAL